MSDAKKSDETNDFRPTPERTSERVVLPPIIVETDDFDEDDVVFQSLPKIAVAPSRPLKNGESGKPRKLFGVFKVPRRLRRSTTRQILWRIATSRRNLGTSISVLLHLILILILASIALTSKVGLLGDPTTVGFSDASDLEFVDDVGDSLDAETTFEIVPDLREISEADSEFEKTVEENTNRATARELADVAGAEAASLAELGDVAPSEPGGGTPLVQQRGATKGRVAANRKRGLPGREGDVTDESEDAVERGLAWLARHQSPDGGWSFDMSAEDSNGRTISCRCSNTTATSGGTQYLRALHPSRTAATAVAVLAFLGAGYVHVDASEANKYRATVDAALTFLKYNATTTEFGRDFRAGATTSDVGAAYVQALVVLALCEAFEMTGDESLRPHAEGGLQFIEAAQLDDGGWRYLSRGDAQFVPNVKDGGDLSILGWQLMALKSGASAGFELRPQVAYRASDFLDSVMEDNGRYYRYLKGQKRSVDENWGTTAVGALSREYLGWTPGAPKLDRCVEQIGDWLAEDASNWQKTKKGTRGRSSRNGAKSAARIGFHGDLYERNLYFSYYAALALHHYGGEVWKREFPKLRDFLVETQARGGLVDNCEDGSWLFYDGYMNDGGRLLNTALATLILETPYRYLPIYRYGADDPSADGAPR